MPQDVAAPLAPAGATVGAPARLRFAGLVLDPARGALFGPDGAEIVLRPKTFALLRLLAENAGRLVERDAIMDAVWPDVTVTDDSITQCVGEIRRALAAALGEDGPRLLRTMPRRGYMLDVAVEGEAVAAAESTSSGPPATGIPATIPVAPARRPSWFTGVHWQPVAWTTFGAMLAAILILFVAERGDGPGASGEGGALATSGTRAPTQREEARRLVAEGRAIVESRGDNVSNSLAARPLFERAISLDPGWQEPYAEAAFTYTNVVLRGESLNPAADLRAAETLAERAVALAPGTAYAHAARAAVLRHQGRYAEALAAYRRALEIEPTWQRARANAAWMEVLLGRPKEAIAPLEAALAAVGPGSPNAPHWRAFLGFAQLYADDGDLGVALLRGVISVRTDIPSDVVALHLAAALAAQGEAENARAVLRMLRESTPDVTPEWLRSRFPALTDALKERQEHLMGLLASVWDRRP